MSSPASLAVAAAIAAAAFLHLLDECRFLIPYRDEILRRHGVAIAAFAAVLFLNLWAVVHLIGRRLALRGTGRKLDHLDRQLRSDGQVERLAERLEELR